MDILHAVLAMTLFLLLGFILRRRGVISEDTRSFLCKLIFNLALPASVFYSIAADCDPAKAIRFDLLSVNLLSTGILCVLSFSLAFLVRGKERRGAFCMCSFRSNMGYIGFPMVQTLYPALMGATGIINGFDSALVVVLSVVALEIFRGNADEGKSPWRVIGRKLLAILRNPLVLATAAGLLAAFLKIPVLEVGFLEKFLSGAKSLAMPLALLCIGASVSFAGIRKNGALLLSVIGLKLLLAPAVAFCLSYFVFGLTGADLCMSVLLLSTPSAVSSYAMAGELGADADATATMIGVTTFLSIPTITASQFLLQHFFL